MGFLFRYILTAILGTAAIHFAMPKVADRFGLVSSESEKGEVRNYDQVVITPIAGSTDKSVKVPESGRAQSVASETDDASDYISDNANTSNQAVIQSQKPPKVIDTPVVIVQEDTRPKSLDKLRQSSPDVLNWAVLCNDAAVFNLDGKRQPDLISGGALVEITAFHTTKKGNQMAKCHIAENNKWSGLYYIASVHLLIFDGTRDGLLLEDEKALREYFTNNARLINRKKIIDDEQVNKNPYSAKLRALVAEYNKSIDDAGDLTAKRDNATGSERTRYANDLRKMQIAQAKQKAEIKELTTKYEQWKKENPLPAADYSSDIQYSRSLRKMKELYPKVRPFGVEPLTD